MKTKNAKLDSAMGGFTRLLHSGKADEWMEEIPTVVVNPLPPDLQKIADVSAVAFPAAFRRAGHFNIHAEFPYHISPQFSYIYL